MNAPRRVGRTLCEAFAEEKRRKEQVSNEYEDVMGRFDWWLATVRHGRLSRDPDRCERASGTMIGWRAKACST
jgi:hypothetical protein